MFLPHLTFLSQNQMYEVVLAMRERKHPHITCTSVTSSKTGHLVEKKRTDGQLFCVEKTVGRSVVLPEQARTSVTGLSSLGATSANAK